MRPWQWRLFPSGMQLGIASQAGKPGAVKGGTVMNINWRRDLDTVFNEANAGGKHVLLDFTAAPM